MPGLGGGVVEVGNDFHITTCHAPKDFKATVTVTAKDPYEFSPGVTVQTHTMGVGDIVGWDVGNKENPLEERMSGNVLLFKVDVIVDGVEEDDEETEGAWVAHSSCKECEEANHVHTDECKALFKSVSIICLPAERPDDEIRLSFPSGFLFEKVDGQYIDAKPSYTVNKINSTTFVLHGHTASAALRDYSIQATHSANSCNDKANFTVMKVTLTSSASMLTLKHGRETDLRITTEPAGLTFNEYRIEATHTNVINWVTLANEQNLTPWQAKAAGVFYLRGVAKLNGAEYYSDNIIVEVQFPSYSQIVGDANVQIMTDSEWQRTLDDCTEGCPNTCPNYSHQSCTVHPPSQRRERGFWVLLDTLNDQYGNTPTEKGDFTFPNALITSIDLGPRPPPEVLDVAPDSGAVYAVASFHTHAPITYLTGSLPVDVGPSVLDQIKDLEDQVPGIVYDYVEYVKEPDYPPENGAIPTGHPKDAQAQRYKTLAFERRPHTK